MNNSELIHPHHRARKAVIYIRQSSGHQVLSNVESRALQHAMRDRALALGWDAGRRCQNGLISWAPLGLAAKQSFRFTSLNLDFGLNLATGRHRCLEFRGFQREVAAFRNSPAG